MWNLKISALSIIYYNHKFYKGFSDSWRIIFPMIGGLFSDDWRIIFPMIEVIILSRCWRMLCHRRFSHHKKQTRRQAAEKGHPEALCLPDVPSLLFLYCFFTALFFAASFASADEFCCEHCHRREHQSHVRCDRCIVTGLYRRGLLRLRLGLCLSLCIGDGHMRFCVCLAQCHGRSCLPERYT